MGNWLSGKTEWLSGKTGKELEEEETQTMKSKKWLTSLGLTLAQMVHRREGQKPPPEPQPVPD